MMDIGKCCVCGAPNRPGISNHVVTVHKYNNFTDCGDPVCDLEVSKKIEIEELEKKAFMKYFFRGNTSEISLPRSDRSLPNAIGFLRQGRIRESQYDFLEFKGKHPLVPVRWGKGFNLSEKVLKYNTLSRHNLHLPLIVVSSYSVPQNISYKRLNVSLYSYCCMMIC